MSSFYIVYLFFVWLSFNSTHCQIRFPEDKETAVENDSCESIRGLRGQCLAFTSCSSLRRIRNYMVLQQLICGFDRDLPYVCCPLERQLPSRRPSITTSRPIREPLTTARIPVSNPNLPQTCGVTSVPAKRIVGGTPSLPGAFPWIAALLIEDFGVKSASCGGALINDDTVLTASHCLIDNGIVKKAASITVRLGEHNIAKRTSNDAEQDFQVKIIITHPNFDSSTYLNDIAILKLKKKVRFTNRIQPICLPTDVSKVLQSDEEVSGRTAVIAGWGRQSFNGAPSEELREAHIQVIPRDQCRSIFEKFVTITDAYMCAGSLDGSKDSCQGDSGGPLAMFDTIRNKYYLMGIVSFGRKCATKGFPGVYTNVKNYVSWVTETINTN